MQGRAGLLEGPLTLSLPLQPGGMDEVSWSLKLRDKNGTTFLRHFFQCPSFLESLLFPPSLIVS